MADDGGLAAFQRRMQAIPEAARKAVQAALVKQARSMVQGMRRLAPVDDGDLRASIVFTRPGNQTPSHSQPGGAEIVPENAVVITAGNAEVRYAHLVEFGTAPHDVSKGGGSFRNRVLAGFHGAGHQHPGTAAQPYFWPAFRLGRKKALAAIKRSIGKAIKEAR